MMKIKVTESALNKLEKEAQKKNSNSFRVIIKGIGWGGPVFGVVPGEQQENDYVEVIKGIRVSASQEHIEKFGGFEVDYSNFILTRGFYIRALRYGSKC